MIIVVEGCDNSGKTTLAMWLAKELRAAFVKVERPASGSDLLAFQSILELAQTYSGTVICDRHVAISEPIYGTICRGGHSLLDQDIALCLDRISLTVYCNPGAAAILSTLADRAQMPGVVEQAKRIIDAYEAFFDPPSDRVIRYDYRVDRRDKLAYSLRKLT